MFTGLIEATGRISSIYRTDRGSDLTIVCNEEFMKGVKLGDSIAINGTCLTVTKFTGNSFSAFASNETLRLTTLQYAVQGDEVNLEKPMTPEKFFGGHIVQGHVDGIGEIVSITEEGEARNVVVRLPSEADRKWVVPKGSIAIDGVSLTVNELFGDSFRLTIIPHTWEVTIFRNYRIGRKVNIEYDIIAKYVVNMLENWNNGDRRIADILNNSPYFNKGG